VFFCLSLTPSLLPRGPLLQGVIGGISAATGYAVGVFAVWMVQSLSRPRLPRPNRVAWWCLAGVSVVAVLTFLYLGSRWQAEIRRLMGEPPASRFQTPAVLVLALLVGVGLVGLFRLLRKAAVAVGRFLGRWVPAPAARVLASLLIIALALGFFSGVLVNGFFSVTDRIYSGVNGETDPGVAPPTDPLRSGGPGSLVPWSSLGNQGRSFVAGGPTLQQLRNFGGPDAIAPIRAYVGLASAPTSTDRADLAVQELLRTNAFARKVLCVITTTGTGWVDPQGPTPLEYMYKGDTALVAMQYSYLPSWLSFLVDKERAREAGRDLFDAVYGVWSKLPVGQRPKLLVFGESLGSFGAESAFSGAAGPAPSSWASGCCRSVFRRTGPAPRSGSGRTFGTPSWSAGTRARSRPVAPAPARCTSAFRTRSCGCRYWRASGRGWPACSR
jgi:uncharacterized membrane protein